MLTTAIRSDTVAPGEVVWLRGLDDTENVRIEKNGDVHSLKIDTGVISRERLFCLIAEWEATNATCNAITEYLQSRDASIFSVASKQVVRDEWHQYTYQILYVDPDQNC